MVGKIFFAYYDPPTAFDDSIHNVEDEKIFDLKIKGSEGNFPRAEVVIQNPQQGLLSPARKTHVYISAEINGGIELLFFGKIVGFPLDMGQELITLDILSQATDWQTTQATFLDTLKVSPFYNELYIAKENRDNPDEILDGYAGLLHWSRIDGSLVLSDILEGNNFIDLADNWIEDSLNSEIGDPPVSKVNIEIETQWLQQGAGDADCTETIRAKFTNTAIGSAQVNTLTPLALERGWQGPRIPRGYEIKETKLVPRANAYGLQQDDLRSAVVTVAGSNYPTATGFEPATRQLTVPRVWYEPKMILRANYEQKRRELMTFSVESDIQNISLTTDQEELISLRIQDPSAVDQSEVLSFKHPSFYQDPGNDLLTLSTYGQEVIEHAVTIAVARLKKAARVVETTVRAPFEPLYEIDCDTNIALTGDKFPGGAIRGKVIAYELQINSQIEQCTFTIASCIGQGLDAAGSGSPVASTVYANAFTAENDNIDGYSDTGQSDTLTSQSNVDGLFWRDDGTSYYVNDESALFRQYDCSTPFDVNTGTHDFSKRMSGGSDLRGLYIHPDGFEFFYCRGDVGFGVKEIRSGRADAILGKPAWEIGNIFQGIQLQDISGDMTGSEIPTSIDFSPDGFEMLIAGTQGNLFHYTLGTAWQMSTRVLTNTFATGLGNIQCARWANSGTNIFLTISGGSMIQQYDLLSAYNTVGMTLNGATFNAASVDEFALSDDASFMIYSRSSTQVFNAEKVGSATMTSAVYYEQTVVPTIDEPIDVAEMEADPEYLVLDATVTNDGETQNGNVVGQAFPDQYLQNNRTEVEVELRSLEPEPELFASVPIDTYNLTLPKQVDLEA